MNVYPRRNDEYEYYDDGEYHYEWTEEDAWDAMTDGMYVDYPGRDVDYEQLGF